MVCIGLLPCFEGLRANISDGKGANDTEAVEAGLNEALLQCSTFLASDQATTLHLCTDISQRVRLKFVANKTKLCGYNLSD